MKLLKLSGVLAMLMCVFVFSSCSDDDDESTGSAADLVGTWQSVKGIYWEKIDGVMDPDYDAEWHEETNTKLEFTADGKMIQYWYNPNTDEWDLDYSVSYTYENGVLTAIHPNEGVVGKANVLTLNSTTLDIEESGTERDNSHVFEYYNRIQYRKL